MRVIFSIIGSLLLIGSVAAGPIVDAVKFSENGHWYRRVVIPPNTTWQECRDMALALSGNLATATSSGENDFLANLAEPYQIFLGGTDELVEGTYEWITAELWDFSAWRTGQPDNASPDEDYIALDPIDSAWSDVQNTFADTQSFVIEWSNRPTDVQTFASHWYRKVPIAPGLTWQTCRDSAVILGGHLATIGGTNPNNFLADFVYPNSTFLGGTDEVSEGAFSWITGEPWSFTAWRPGEPSNLTPDEDYLVLNSADSLWSDELNVFDSVQVFVVEYESCCWGLKGNVDCDPDDINDIRDLVKFINNIFITFEEFCCLEEAEMSGDGIIDVRDIVAMINALFITFDPKPCE